MARLRSDGAVFGKESTTATVEYENHRGAANGVDSPFSNGLAEVTVESDPAIVRPGERYCYKIVGSSRYRNQNALGAVLGRHYHFRQYLRIGSAVTMTSNSAVMQVVQAGNQRAAITVLGTPSGRLLRLRNAADVQIGPDGPGIDLDRWYRMEMHIYQDPVPTTTNGIIEAQVYDDTDTLVWSEGSTAANAGTTVLDGLRSGNLSATNPTVPFYVSNIGVNDDQGSGQTSWLGPGILVAMLPAADVSIGNWEAGFGGLTNLFEAVNNLPPQGQGAGGTTATTQIRNAVAATNSIYTAETGAYTDPLASGGAGMGASDIVKALRVVARVASTEATARSDSVSTAAVSGNPSSITSSFSTATNAVSVGSDTADPPVAWRTLSTDFANDPSVVLGSPARIRVHRANSQASRVEQCDLLAMIVDYEPVTAAPPASAFVPRTIML